jgi:hypothetical protein
MAASIVSSNNNGNNHPKRAFASHTPKWQHFQATLMIASKKVGMITKEETEVYTYQCQYSHHVYLQLLIMLKPRVWKQMKNNSDKRYARVNQVLELQEDVPNMIGGTLIKEANSPDEEPIQPGTKCCPSDQLFLEDESGWVALKLSEEDSMHCYCPGIMVGVQGAVNNLGTSIVDGALIVPALLPLSMVPSGSLTPLPLPILLLIC